VQRADQDYLIHRDENGSGEKWRHGLSSWQDADQYPRDQHDNQDDRVDNRFGYSAPEL
jgi:hypothetical protein